MTPDCFAVVPAAGIGTRMDSSIPKQYLPLLGRPVLVHVLERLAAVPEVSALYVVLREDDRWWGGLDFQVDVPVHTVAGGAERADSVRLALAALAGRAAPDDWVMVHDAVRPCVAPDDLATLVRELRDDPVGGLLALPVRDTMKRSGPDGRVAATIDRSTLWHALTPQMFRYALLCAAMARADAAVTDEASAVERTGHRPRLVTGRADNIKLTRASDLRLAECILAADAGP